MKSIYRVVAVICAIVSLSALARAQAPQTAVPSTAPVVVTSVLTAPGVVTRVLPRYTGEAMRAHIEGTVLLDAVVLADGAVGDVAVAQSLDRNYGLDEEAVKTIRQWLFTPGTLDGTPVPVHVQIDVKFRLR